MIKTGPDDTDQLTTYVDRPRVGPLVVMSVPLLCASFHLSRIVGCQGQTLETTTSRDGPSRDKVVQGESIQRPESTSWTLYGLIHYFSQRICCIRIVTSGVGVPDVVPSFETFEAISVSIVHILGIGNELGRGRSVGSRNLKWRTG